MLWSAASTAQTIDTYRAENEIRLMEMENQLRRVTGQYEEAMFRLTQVNRRLERSLEDMEFRLNELEQRLATAGIAPAEIGTSSDAVASRAAEAAPAGSPSVDTAADKAAPVGAAGDTMLIDGKPVNILRTPEQAAAAGVASVPPAGAAANPETSPALFVEGDTPEQQYETAFAHLRRNDLEKAEGAFRGFLALHPGHELAPNAKYWLGKTYFARGDYDRATREFLEGYESFGDAEKAPDTLLHLGLSLGELGQSEDACAAFSELSARYPNADASITQRATTAEQAVGCS